MGLSSRFALWVACVVVPMTVAKAAPDHADHAGHGSTHGADQGASHAHHQHMTASSHADHGIPTEEAPGTASAPPVPTDHAADAFFPPDRMAAARKLLMHEGHMTYSQVLAERLELRHRSGSSSFAWEGEASTGTDVSRFVLETEGDAKLGKALEEGEIQAKWRRAINPWFNAEFGLRQDLVGPARTYLTAGVEGLLPYWIETQALVFVSNKGDVHARLELETDQRITQRLVLQPSAEIEVAFQDVRELGITSPIPEWAIGARLRYEIQPYFAPYIGVERRKEHTGSQEHSASGGRSFASTNVLLGLRAWF